MTTVGVTGASGLLGWHLCARLTTDNSRGVRVAGRPEFAEPSLLRDFVRGCDAVIHLAGVNRGDDAEIEAVNRLLAERLVDAFTAEDASPHLVFASSTHVDRDTTYGRSKRASTETFQRWADRAGAKFTNLILPHVFGELGRPFHNSVVSTFCHQLANGGQPEIDRDGDLDLLHAQEVAVLCLKVLADSVVGSVRPRGRPIRVSEMLELARGQARSYLSGVIPAFEDLFELRMFNTFRSYLYPHHYPRRLDLRTDARGTLFEAVKTLHGGQAFLSTTKPGVTRGEHFHLNKIERFLVVQGQAVIRLRRLGDERIVEFHVDGSEPAFVDMPTLHTHNITNVGDGDLTTLFWSHEIFDVDAPDTWPEGVLAGPIR